MEYYSAIRNDFIKFLGKWMYVENIILSKVNQSQKSRHNMQSLIIGCQPQKALNTPETTHRPYEAQEKQGPKSESLSPSEEIK